MNIFIYNSSTKFGIFTFPKSDYTRLRSEFPSLPSKYEYDGHLVHIIPNTLEAMCQMNDFLDKYGYIAVSDIPKPKTTIIQMIVNIFKK